MIPLILAVVIGALGITVRVFIKRRNLAVNKCNNHQTKMTNLLYYRRIVFSHDDNPLMIECPPHFKLYPAPKDFPKPVSAIGHHHHFFDFAIPARSGVTGVTDISYSLSKKPVFDELQHYPIRDEIVHTTDADIRFKEIFDLINAISTRTVISYHSIYQCWFKDLEDVEAPPKYGQRFYHHPDTGAPTEIVSTAPHILMDETGLCLIDQNSKANNITISHLFNAYFGMTEEKLRKKLRNVCRVLSKAKEFRSLDESVSFLLYITAIEAMVDIEYAGHKPDQCEECGQPKFSVSKKFKGFIDRYCYTIENRIKNRIYGLRSKMVHTGHMLPTRNRSFYIESQQDLDSQFGESISKEDLQMTASIAQTCFKSFLYSKSELIQ